MHIINKTKINTLLVGTKLGTVVLLIASMMYSFDKSFGDTDMLWIFAMRRAQLITNIMCSSTSIEKSIGVGGRFGDCQNKPVKWKK